MIVIFQSNSWYLANDSRIGTILKLYFIVNGENNFYQNQSILRKWSSLHQYRLRLVKARGSIQGFLWVKISNLGADLVGQNMILTSKNIRNELLLNYHKLKKIPQIMTTNFEICDFMRQRGKSTSPLSSLYAIWGFNHPPPPWAQGFTHVGLSHAGLPTPLRLSLTLCTAGGGALAGWWVDQIGIHL